VRISLSVSLVVHTVVVVLASLVFLDRSDVELADPFLIEIRAARPLPDSEPVAVFIEPPPPPVPVELPPDLEEIEIEDEAGTWDSLDQEASAAPAVASEWDPPIPFRKLTLRLRASRPLRPPGVESRAATSPRVEPNRNAASRPQRPGGVSRGPVVMERELPSYPVRARRNGWEGRVSLRLLVTAEGRVERVEIERSSGRTCLDQAAVVAALCWRFRPALRDGRAVASWHRIALRFRLLSG